MGGIETLFGDKDLRIALIVNPDLVKKHLQKTEGLLRHLAKIEKAEDALEKGISSNEKMILRILRHSGLFDKALFAKVVEFKAVLEKLKVASGSSADLKIQEKLKVESDLVEILLSITKKVEKIKETCESSIELLDPKKRNFFAKEVELGKQIVAEIEWIYNHRQDSDENKKSHEIKTSLFAYYNAVSHDVELLTSIYKNIFENIKKVLESLSNQIKLLESKKSQKSLMVKLEFDYADKTLSSILSMCNLEIKEDAEIKGIMENLVHARKYHKEFLDHLFEMLEKTKSSLSEKTYWH